MDDPLAEAIDKLSSSTYTDASRLEDFHKVLRVSTPAAMDALKIFKTLLAFLDGCKHVDQILSVITTLYMQSAKKEIVECNVAKIAAKLMQIQQGYVEARD
jgi:hypothetical protein